MPTQHLFVQRGQLFAMRIDDGSVEQLTHARGLVELGGGRVMAELPGPYAFAGP